MLFKEKFDLKILRIYQKLPPKIGGMEKHILYLTKEQISEGIKVKLFFCEGDKVNNDDVKFNFINYTKIKPQSISNFLFYLNIILYCTFNRERFDAVHIHGDWSCFIFSKILKYLTSAKVSLGSFHGKIQLKKVKSLKFAYEQLDIMYTTGRSEQNILNSLLDIQVYWIHSGVNSEFYKSKKHEKSQDVLTVANCLPVKNIDFLLEVAKSLPNYNFLHIGGGNFEHYAYKAKINEIENIAFKGSCSVDEIANAMRDSKVFLLTSLQEGTPTVVLEALVSGCYVLTSNCCDYSGILNDANGAVCEEFDVGTFKSKLSYVLEDKAAEKGFNDTDYSEFSWKSVARRVTGLLNDNIHN